MGPKPNIELVIVAREWNMLINWAWSQRKMKELLLGKGNGMLAGQKKKKKEVVTRVMEGADPRLMFIHSFT